MGGQLSLPREQSACPTVSIPQQVWEGCKPKMPALSSRMSARAQSCCYEQSHALEKAVPVGQTQPAELEGGLRRKQSIPMPLGSGADRKGLGSKQKRFGISVI